MAKHNEVITAEQFQAKYGKARPSKYRAVPTMYGGVRYASKAEAARAAELDVMVECGQIRWWIGQPTFRLGTALNVYKADALVVGNGRNNVYVEDVKGAWTPKFKKDVKLWEAFGPCDLHIRCKGHTTIIPSARDYTL